MHLKDNTPIPAMATGIAECQDPFIEIISDIMKYNDINKICNVLKEVNNVTMFSMEQIEEICSVAIKQAGKCKSVLEAKLNINQAFDVIADGLNHIAIVDQYHNVIYGASLRFNRRELWEAVHKVQNERSITVEQVLILAEIWIESKCVIIGPEGELIRNGKPRVKKNLFFNAFKTVANQNG